MRLQYDTGPRNSWSGTAETIVLRTASLKFALNRLFVLPQGPEHVHRYKIYRRAQEQSESRESEQFRPKSHLKRGTVPNELRMARLPMVVDLERLGVDPSRDTRSAALIKSFRQSDRREGPRSLPFFIRPLDISL